jgi:tRNA uridine 5-carboxymethylaminomethyl modification enzyme
MMTSRAEHRLLLREDNADERLTEIGRRLGLVSSKRYAAFCRRRDRLAAELERLSSTILSPSAGTNDRLAALGTAPLRKPASLLELLRRPEVNYVALQQNFEGVEDSLVAERVEIRVKYQGYVARQSAEAERLRALEEMRVPADLDYAALGGLSREVTEKLSRVRPLSIGQASRIPGVTPAAVSILIVHLRAARARATVRQAEAKEGS